MRDDKAEVGSAMAVVAVSNRHDPRGLCRRHGRGHDHGATSHRFETTAPSAETTAPPTETTAPATDTTEAAGGEAYQVALIYPGTADDLSWSNAWFDGAAAGDGSQPQHIESSRSNC